jgi:Tfp pilus assembly protein PilX
MRQPSLGSQRGMATLVVAVVLLVCITLIALFANRSIVFEQRTSANQYRSTKALEAAEAGLEWAFAQLNTPLNLGTSCTTAGGTKTFRDNYLNPAATSPPVYAATAGTFSTATPACARQSGGGWTCSCPPGTSTTVAAPTCDGATTGACPKFVVQFERVQDPALALQCASGATNCVISAVKVTSTGYTNVDPSPDGTAQVSQMFKTISGLATPPAAPLTAKGPVDISGNVEVTNTDPSTGGITINAGGDVTLSGGAQVYTISGTPPGASIASNDTSLSTLSDDQMFETFFGMPKTQFMNMPATTQIPPAQPACALTFSCTGTYGATELGNAVAAGANIIWVNGVLDLSGNGQYGTATNPVIIIATGNIHVNGTVNIFGVIYSQASIWDNSGGGTATICGAAIAEGAFTGVGTPNPTYCPNVFNILKKTTGAFGKVPGSWRDF